MKTQRVNAYKSGKGIAVYYIEEWDDESHEWLTIGEAYTNLELITAHVEKNNISYLYDRVKEIMNEDKT